MSGWISAEPIAFAGGLRAVLCIVGVGFCVYGYLRADYGMLAFARAIRAKMVWRRRVFLVAIAVIFGLFFAQTMIVRAYNPDPEIPSYTGNAVLLISLTILNLLVAHQVTGWGNFEHILAGIPLTPDASDRAYAVSSDTRAILHEMATQIQIATLGVDEIAESTSRGEPIPEAKLIAVSEHMDAISDQHRQVQILVQSLSKTPEEIGA